MKSRVILTVFLLVTLGLSAGETASSVPDFIRSALNDQARPEDDRARDTHRKPGQVLTFFEVKPGQKVADLMSGTGYYTEILCRAVGSQGQVYAQNSPFIVERFKERLGPDGIWSKKFATPAWQNVTKRVAVLEDPGLPEGQLDMAMMALFYHDTFWQEVDRSKMNRAIFKALKPGGIFGIIDHHAQAGSGDRDVQTLHRVDMALVVKEIEAAGFVLEAESSMLHHPEDKRDYNIFRDFQTNRDQTDRFVLRFRKPAH